MQNTNPNVVISCHCRAYPETFKAEYSFEDFTVSIMQSLSNLIETVSTILTCSVQSYLFSVEGIQANFSLYVYGISQNQCKNDVHTHKCKQTYEQNVEKGQRETKTKQNCMG